MSDLLVRALGAIALVAVLSASNLYALTIDVRYDDPVGAGFFDPELGAARRAALEYAVDVWATALAGTVPIVIEAQMPSAGGDGSGALLASAGPVSLHRDFGGAPAGIWFAAALANQLGTADVNGPDTAEIRVLFNADVDRADVLGSVRWYYGLDAAPGADLDFVTIALHEIGHGLGFIQGVDGASGDWSVGDAPLVLDTMLVRDGVGDFAHVSVAERRAAVMSAGGLRWHGANVVAFNGDAMAVFAPDPFIAGSSVGHWDPDLAPGELMGPSYTGGALHDLGALLPALVDMGWQLAGASPTPRASRAPATPTPTPRRVPTFARPSARERIYVTDFDGGGVAVLDAASRAALPGTPIDLGGGPLGIAVSPNGRRLYVADLHAGTLVVVSTRTHRVLARLAIGDSANGVAVTPDGVFVVVTDTATDSAAVVASEPLALLGRVSVGPRPAGVAVDPSGRFAFVADFGGGFDGATMTVVNIAARWREAIMSLVRSGGPLFGTEAPVAVAIAAESGRGWVVAHRSRTAIGFDSAAYEIERFIAQPAGESRPEAVAISRSGAVAYIASHASVSGAGTVTVVDTVNGAVVAQIDVGLVPEALALSADESLLYVANTGSGTVSIINTAAREVVGTIPTGGSPMGIAVSHMPASFCAADCNADSVVRINELVSAVGIALGTGELGSCEEADVNADGSVAIAELVQAVNAAIGGCVDIEWL